MFNAIVDVDNDDGETTRRVLNASNMGEWSICTSGLG